MAPTAAAASLRYLTNVSLHEGMAASQCLCWATPGCPRGGPSGLGRQMLWSFHTSTLSNRLTAQACAAGQARISMAHIAVHRKF